MLLVISDSGYFDLGFDSYFSREKCRVTCTKKILYCSFEDPKAIVSNVMAASGNYGLQCLVIDYPWSNIEALQSALYIKIHFPLIHVVVYSTGGYRFNELEASYLEILGAKLNVGFSGVCSALMKKQMQVSAIDIIYESVSRFVEISKKDALLISFILTGFRLKDIAIANNKDIKRVYYDRSRLLNKLSIRNNIELEGKIRCFVLCNTSGGRGERVSTSERKTGFIDLCDMVKQ